jgi:hypothetical protein
MMSTKRRSKSAPELEACVLDTETKRETNVRDEVSLKFVQVNVEGAVEAEGGSDR